MSIIICNELCQCGKLFIRKQKREIEFLMKIFIEILQLWFLIARVSSNWFVCSVNLH